MDRENTPDMNLHVRVFRACQLVITPDTWRFRYINDPYWRLYRNEEEGAHVTTDDEVLSVRPGWLSVIPARVNIKLSCDRPIRHFYAHFDVIGMPNIALRELFDRPFQKPCEPHNEQIIQRVVPQLVPQPEGGEPVSVLAQCQIKTLIYESLSWHLQAVPTKKIDDCWSLVERIQPILPAFTYIETHLASDLSNPFLAHLCCMSEGHFIRTFHTSTGQTPAQYVMEQRVTFAARRLLQTTDSISRIAEEAGFVNRDYFSRIFARQTGLPPAAFRRSRYVDRE